MMSFSVFSIFCEDIRQELQGTETLVGVLSDGLNLFGKPTIINKIAVYTKIYFPIDHSPNNITINFIGIDGNTIASTPFDRNMIEQFIKQAKDFGMDRAGIKSIFVVGGFPVNESGFLKVIVSFDGHEITSGILKVGLLESPMRVPSNFAQPQSEQSPPVPPAS